MSLVSVRSLLRLEAGIVFYASTAEGAAEKYFDYLCFMKTVAVNINFKRMSVAFREHVRLKAKNAGSSIVYLQGDKLVKENFSNADKSQSANKPLIDKK